MNSAERTVMHRVLNIPELLDMVFSFLEPESNAVNARICRRWSEIALDALWKDVRDVQLLFRLLAPLRVCGGKDEFLEFERMPDSTDWKRFEKYGKRVRRLEYDVQRCHTPLKQNVFDDVARTRTRLDILPNMHTLLWKAPLSLAVMFMHKRMKNFSVYLPELKEISPHPFFKDVADRMPNLTSLDLRSTVPMHKFEAEVVKLFEHLPKIQKVTFPRYYFTTRIAEALSRLENLGIIEFQYLDDQGSGNVNDVVPFIPSLTEGAFPMLWDHSMAASFEDAARFLNIPFAPTNLTMLYIDSYVIETPAVVRNLLNTISENCQLLTFLALVSLRDASSSSVLSLENEYDPDLAITIDTLKPLFKLPNLTTLELVHQYPLALKSEDIRLFAASWPALRSLLLNTEPVLLSKSNLTLDDLLPFAQHCPQLRHLGLFIDARSTTSISSSPSPSSSSFPPQTVQFKALERLSMGVSLIEDDNAVTLFLSQILPLNCQVDSGITWDESFPVHEEVSSVVQERCTLWSKVAELLPVLTKLRTQERARTKAMEMELEDLRMRTKVLKDSAALGKGKMQEGVTYLLPEERSMEVTADDVIKVMQFERKEHKKETMRLKKEKADLEKRLEALAQQAERTAQALTRMEARFELALAQQAERFELALAQQAERATQVEARFQSSLAQIQLSLARETERASQAEKALAEAHTAQAKKLEDIEAFIASGCRTDTIAYYRIKNRARSAGKLRGA